MRPILSVDAAGLSGTVRSRSLREMIRRRITLVLNKLGNDVEMISQVWIGKRTPDTLAPDKSDFLGRKFARCSTNKN